MTKELFELGEVPELGYVPKKMHKFHRGFFSSGIDLVVNKKVDYPFFGENKKLFN